MSTNGVLIIVVYLYVVCIFSKPSDRLTNSSIISPQQFPAMVSVCKIQTKFAFYNVIWGNYVIRQEIKYCYYETNFNWIYFFTIFFFPSARVLGNNLWIYMSMKTLICTWKSDHLNRMSTSSYTCTKHIN
jgi:hypothetical protein